MLLVEERKALEKLANPRNFAKGMGEAVAKRTILRTKEDGTLETWGDVAERVALGNSLLHLSGAQDRLFLEEYIGQGLILMSGRHLQHGDINQPSRTMELFTNCSTSPTSFMKYLLLLNGSGVGRDYSDHTCLVDWSYMPDVVTVLSKSHPNYMPKFRSLDEIQFNPDKDIVHIIEDSREGWAKGIELLECMAYQKVFKGHRVIFDFSNVRREGSPIGGMQNRPASGPVDTMDTYLKVFSVKHLNYAPWKQALYIDHYLAENVLVGGARRSARMATKWYKDPDITEFINIKKDGGLWTANMSVLVDRDFWKNASMENLSDQSRLAVQVSMAQYYNKSGEPGYINVDRLDHNVKGKRELQKNFELGSKKYKLSLEGADLYKDIIEATKKSPYYMIVNPCITGDTLIAVADGRNAVSIRQLAEEGKDVPVYCFDNAGKTCIRLMRNPRITGYNKKILKVTLDDGNSIRVTENHKLRLTSGEYKEAKDLIPGDGLKILTKYHASIKDIFPDANSRSQDYIWVNDGKKSNKSEHRLISEFNTGEITPKGSVIHHIDFNALNNSPDNLAVMTKEAHDELHAKSMMGTNNPYFRMSDEWRKNFRERSVHTGKENGRYCGKTHEELLNIAIELTKKLGRRISYKEWQAYAKENNLPQHLSIWRRNEFGSINGLCIKAAIHCGLEKDLVNLDPRTQRVYLKAIEQGYSVKILDNTIYVERTCEGCKENFWASYAMREQGFCTKGCMIDQIKVEVKQKTDEQLDLYTKLKFTLGRTPLRKEYETACSKQGVIKRFGSKYGFKGFRELQLAAANYNHRVISVEVDGEEDVYNGTVDEFHNFFIGGFETQTENKKPKWIFVNNRQCGEICLASYGAFCVIGDLAPFHADSLSDIKEAGRLLVRALIRVNTMDSVYHMEVKRTNRIGISLTGIHEFAWKFFGVSFNDMVRTPMSENVEAFWNFLTELSEECREEAKKYSEELGLEVPHTLETIKPAGSVSKLFDLTEGCHLPSMKYYLRWVQFPTGSPLVEQYREMGYPVRDLKIYENTTIVGFPTKPLINKVMPADKITVAGEASMENQYRYLQLLEEYWIRSKVRKSEIQGNQISYTLKYDPYHTRFAKYHKTILMNQGNVKCCSVMPQIEATVYEYQPEEPITEDKYKELISNIKDNSFEEDIDMEHLRCSNGACPI